MEMARGQELDDLIGFLKPGVKPDIKLVALQTILGLTGSQDGSQQLGDSDTALDELVRLCVEPAVTSHSASLCLVNLSASVAVARRLLSGAALVPLLLRRVVDPDSRLADHGCMILSNVSRDPTLCRLVWQQMVDTDDVSIERLVFVLGQKDFNRSGAALNYLATLLANLTRLSEASSQVLNRDQVVLQRILSILHKSESLTRRHGAAAILKNCSFQTDAHEWLLGASVDVLPHLLLPLAGSDQLDDDEMERLPADLQYLPDDKQREPDLDVRITVLQTLTQLCTTGVCREMIRASGAYLVLREYHKWEQDEPTLDLCEQLVNILLRTEEEIGVDNLKTLNTSLDGKSETA